MSQATYKDHGGKTRKYPQTGRPSSVLDTSEAITNSVPITSRPQRGLLTDDEQARDNLGFTNPNLHQRIDPKNPPDPVSVKTTQMTMQVARGAEVQARDYSMQIEGVNLYRTTTYNVHDEESVTSEIP